jgi:hypothetical protein
MSAAISSTTGRPCGVALVCQVWDVPRSTYYAQASGQATEATEPKRRGPQPGISDEALLAAIKNDLERSPFVGEGHGGMSWSAPQTINDRAGGGLNLWPDLAVGPTGNLYAAWLDDRGRGDDGRGRREGQRYDGEDREHIVAHRSSDMWSRARIPNGRGAVPRPFLVGTRSSGAPLHAAQPVSPARRLIL